MGTCGGKKEEKPEDAGPSKGLSVTRRARDFQAAERVITVEKGAADDLGVRVHPVAEGLLLLGCAADGPAAKTELAEMGTAPDGATAWVIAEAGDGPVGTEDALGAAADGQTELRLLMRQRGVAPRVWVTAPGHGALAGAYDLVDPDELPGGGHNGRFVWRSGAQTVHCTAEGRWAVATARADMHWLRSEETEPGVMPYDATAWEAMRDGLADAALEAAGLPKLREVAAACGVELAPTAEEGAVRGLLRDHRENAVPAPAEEPPRSPCPGAEWVAEPDVALSGFPPKVSPVVRVRIRAYFPAKRRREFQEEVARGAAEQITADHIEVLQPSDGAILGTVRLRVRGIPGAYAAADDVIKHLSADAYWRPRARGAVKEAGVEQMRRLRAVEDGERAALAVAMKYLQGLAQVADKEVLRLWFRAWVTDCADWIRQQQEQESRARRAMGLCAMLMARSDRHTQAWAWSALLRHSLIGSRRRAEAELERQQEVASPPPPAAVQSVFSQFSMAEPPSGLARSPSPESQPAADPQPASRPDPPVQDRHCVYAAPPPAAVPRQEVVAAAPPPAGCTVVARSPLVPPGPPLRRFPRPQHPLPFAHFTQLHPADVRDRLGFLPPARSSPLLAHRFLQGAAAVGRRVVEDCVDRIEARVRGRLAADPSPDQMGTSLRAPPYSAAFAEAAAALHKWMVEPVLEEVLRAYDSTLMSQLWVKVEVVSPFWTADGRLDYVFKSPSGVPLLPILLRDQRVLAGSAAMAWGQVAVVHQLMQEAYPQLHPLETYGIVTSGSRWSFMCLSSDDELQSKEYTWCNDARDIVAALLFVVASARRHL